MERHQVPIRGLGARKIAGLVEIRRFVTLWKMKESSEPFIFGKSEETVVKHREELDELRKEGLRPFPGEIEKNELDLFFIDTFNSSLKKLTKRFGVKDISPVVPEQVHLLKAAGYEKYTENGGGDAAMLPTESTILVNTGSKKFQDPLAKYRGLWHEMVHTRGHEKFYSHEVEDLLVTYRSGYQILDKGLVEQGKDLKPSRFVGFNEAMTELIAGLLWHTEEDELRNKLNLPSLSPEEKESSEVLVVGYTEQVKLLTYIIGRLNGEPGENPVGDFVRGYFSGDMMHLRRIEKVWGKGALRILSYLGEDITAAGRELNKQVYAFFYEEDPSAREEMAKKIFANRGVDS